MDILIPTAAAAAVLAVNVSVRAVCRSYLRRRAAEMR